MISLFLTCQLCKKPITVQVDPSAGQEMIDMLSRLACCNECAVDRGYIKRRQQKMPMEPQEQKLPYADK